VLDNFGKSFGTTPDGDEIFANQEVTLDIVSVSYNVHTKKGATEDMPKTVRVGYYYGVSDVISEWVCPEHTGFAREKFLTWWGARTKDIPPPPTAYDVVSLASAGALLEPKRIKVICDERGFFRVLDYFELSKPDPNSSGLSDMGLSDDEIPF